jgi:hypothetical protein
MIRFAKSMHEPFLILVIQNNDGDFPHLEQALAKRGLKFRLQRVKFGAEATDYLRGKGLFSDRKKYPVPSLMALKLPLAPGGLELLRVKAHSGMRHLPVLAFGPSDPTLVQLAALTGSNCYFLDEDKPEAFADIVAMLDQFRRGLSQGQHPSHN